MSANLQVQGRAVPIVVPTQNPETPYKLNEKKIESILKNRDVARKKIVLISISGAFRKGKSFMLNLLIAYLDWLERNQEGEWLDKDTPMDRFHYQDGTEPDTNGIVMWNKPYLLKGEDGEEYAVFLMDTQGTFDHNSSVRECAAIFAMSTLLSSVQIFNLDKQIQSDDLNNLHLFTELARLVKSENPKEKNANPAPFQKLLFLIRDWQNSRKYKYGFRGGESYLEEILQVKDDQQRENKAVRQNLRASFEKLEAFLMPHPGKHVANNNSKTNLGEIDDEFETELKRFVPDLFKSENLLCKKINGQEITSGELCELLKSYMNIFNSDELPEPKTILDATAEAVALAAEQTAKETYDKTMKKHEDLCNLKELDKLQESAVAAGLEKFEARPKIGEDTGAKNMRSLKDYFTSRHMEFKKIVEHNIKLNEAKEELEKKKNEAAILAAEEAAKKEYGNMMEKHKELCDLRELEKLQENAVATGLKKFKASLEKLKGNGEKNMQVLQQYFKSQYAKYKKNVEKNIELDKAQKEADRARKELSARPVEYRYIERPSSGESQPPSNQTVRVVVVREPSPPRSLFDLIGLGRPRPPLGRPGGIGGCYGIPE